MIHHCLTCNTSWLIIIMEWKKCDMFPVIYILDRLAEKHVNKLVRRNSLSDGETGSKHTTDRYWMESKQMTEDL